MAVLLAELLKLVFALVMLPEAGLSTSAGGLISLSRAGAILVKIRELAVRSPGHALHAAESLGVRA